jgi:uncharacterized membrane protein YhaH (DUF805 family)
MHRENNNKENKDRPPTCEEVGTFIYAGALVVMGVILLAAFIIHHDFNPENESSRNDYKNINRALVIYPILATAVLVITCNLNPFHDFVKRKWNVFVFWTVTSIVSVFLVCAFMYYTIEFGIYLFPDESKEAVH